MKRVGAASALTSTAFHEAGHAVLAWHFSYPFKHVSIVPDGDALGGFLHADPDMFPFSTAREKEKTRREWIVISQAGVEAQRLVDPHPEPFAGQADDENAHDIANRLGLVSSVADDAELGRVLEPFRRRARRLVRERRAHIETLASALLERSRMTDEDVDELFEFMKLI